MLTYSRSRVVATRERIRSSVMENQIEKKEHLHYNHTDSCNHARWNSRECYQFMYNKPWQKVADFYLNLVNGRLPLSDLLGNERPSSSNTSTQSVAGSLEAREQTDLPDLQTKDRSGRWARVTYKIVLSYDGNSFDGWQKQPGLNTVQGLVENSLGNFVDERKAQKLKEKSLPLEAAVNVAGRTDKGVTALNQVCSFYTWRTDVKVRDVEDAINSASPGKLRVISVLKVLRDFHPNFSAKWRHYLYIFPITDGEGQISETVRDGVKPDPIRQHSEQRNGWPESEREEKDESGEVDIEDGYESGNKPKGFSVQRVNQLLHQLEGKSLSYSMFARDTKASRSTGPPTECFLYHARATEAILPCADEVYAGKNTGQKVMCVELVANRFLRRMVRVLVATSIREAAAGADDDALLKLMEATCRRATAPPAPPDGLCLVDVGYAEFNPENALIP